MLVGEEGGGAGAGGGAGGFCATASGTRIANAMASKTKIRTRWLIGRSLGRGSSVIQNPRAFARSSQGSLLENQHNLDVAVHGGDLLAQL
jgi:hypothetical protein